MQRGCTSHPEVRRCLVWYRIAFYNIRFGVLSGHDGSLRVWSVADRHCVFEQAVRYVLQDAYDARSDNVMRDVTGAPVEDGRSNACSKLPSVAQLHRHGWCRQYNKDLPVNVYSRSIACVTTARRPPI